MIEKNLKMVIDSIKQCFSQYGGSTIEFGTPYSERSTNIEPLVLDYSGIITLSGQFVGGVVISFPKQMLNEVAKAMLGLSFLLNQPI